MVSRTGKLPTGQEKAGKTVTKGSAAHPARRRRTPAVLHPTGRDPRLEFNDDEWHDMVATAAYFRAEARGFQGGSEDEDWFEAEAQLREQLAQAEDEADEKLEG
jgi:hypothetical protein